jgi:N-acyl amino acid synthase of PEP-CTERM/exosortase system
MFDEFYEVILADTEAARIIHRKIRYHVYCVERGFEDAEAFPNGQESDRWDDDAAQFIVRERVTGHCVAAARLILPRTAEFPVEALRCLVPLATAGDRRRTTAEVSRICVIRTPNPIGLNRHLGHGFGYVTRKREFEVLLGMLRAINAYCLARRIESCYLLVTETFARLLRLMGVVLYQAGRATDHRGYRTPYLVHLREAAASMRDRSEPMRQLLDSPAPAYRRSSEIDDDAIDPDSLLIEPVVAAA